ncbi:hypothetical protein T265_13476, partial [Opisthorchis viverrini]
MTDKKVKHPNTGDSAGDADKIYPQLKAIDDNLMEKIKKTAATVGDSAVDAPTRYHTGIRIPCCLLTFTSTFKLYPLHLYLSSRLIT